MFKKEWHFNNLCVCATTVFGLVYSRPPSIGSDPIMSSTSDHHVPNVRNVVQYDDDDDDDDRNVYVCSNVCSKLWSCPRPVMVLLLFSLSH